MKRACAFACALACGLILGFYLGETQKPEHKVEHELQQKLDLSQWQVQHLVDSFKIVTDSLKRSSAYSFKSGYIEGQIDQTRYIFSLIDNAILLERSNRMASLTNDAMKFPTWSR